MHSQHAREDHKSDALPRVLNVAHISIQSSKPSGNHILPLLLLHSNIPTLAIKNPIVIMPTPQITIVGSLNTDLITRTSRLPAPGETLLSESFATGSGGKGANQAVACARLSRVQNSKTPADLTIRMIGAIGSDTFGQDLVSDLQSNGIDVSGVVKKEGARSGVAVIIVDEGTGENRILMSPNANFSLRLGDFEGLMAAEVPGLLVLQLEIPVEVTVQILKVARAKGVGVLMNPAPARVLPREAWEGVEHLIVNEGEAATVVGGVGEGVSWVEGGEHVDRLVGLGVRHFVVTLGGEGVVYIDTRLRRRWVFRASEVEVVDTTAAGDTFVGAYAVAVVRQRGRKGNVAAAVKWANLAAAKTVERKGAQAAIPWLDEIEAFDADKQEEDGHFIDEGKLSS